MMRAKLVRFHIISILLALTTLPENTTCGKAREKRRRSQSPSSVASDQNPPPNSDILAFLTEFINQNCNPSSLESAAIVTSRPRSPTSSGDAIPGPSRAWSPSSPRYSNRGAKRPRSPSSAGSSIGSPKRSRSPSNIEYVVPGPTQLQYASPQDRYFIPAHKIRRLGEKCDMSTICEEGACCLDKIRTRVCTPLSNRGQRCSVRHLCPIYTRYCPCGLYQGTCENGKCS